MKGLTLIPKKIDLVLIGAGYGHLEVIRQLALYPVADVRVTLVTPESLAAFSGRIAQAIRSPMDEAELEFDIRRICAWAGIRYIKRRVVGIQRDLKRILCDGHPPIRYDVLSLNTGGAPVVPEGFAQEDWIWPVKPLKPFLDRVRSVLESSAGATRLTVLGGGAAGCEMALALADAARERAHGQLAVRLVARKILPGFSRAARAAMIDELERADVEVMHGCSVQAAQNHRLLLDDGQALETDVLILATGPRPQSWLADSGLDTDAEGFVKVNPHLQTSDPDIFAVGDICAFSHPVPRNRILAIEEGRLLSDNLHRYIARRELKRFDEHVSNRAIIELGHNRALMVGRRFVTRGRLPALIRHQRDTTYFDSLVHLPELPDDGQPTQGVRIVPEDLPMESVTISGQGAAAGLGQSLVRRVLDRIGVEAVQGVWVGVAEADDAAVVRVPGGKEWVQSVSMLRGILTDPWTLGRIATLHAMGNIYAMGGEVHSVMATAVVPYAATPLMEEDLFMLMDGSQQELSAHGAALIGGHSSEGLELMFGLSVNGMVAEGAWLSKRITEPGQALVMIKSLGTGFVLTAHRQARAHTRWVEEAMVSMMQSVRDAVPVAREHGVTACTHVTGYGLAGNLLEMVQDAAVGARIRLSQLPLLSAVPQLVDRGVTSALYRQNLGAQARMDYAENLSKQPAFQALFDPQTSGGLVFAVPEGNARSLCDALARAGYVAAVIGDTGHEASGRLAVLPD
ncbi:MAG: selenide, water dikinase SelD [Gammaproteobacteria bacterium]|nr:MAG: selenide, water dikinase SelD [Gammaproteobacteria bacterium]